MAVVVNLCRFLVALTFIFSGFVKAIDPLGTQYKIEDYLEALGMGDYVPGIAVLGASVVLSAFEFCLGLFLLFAIHRRSVSRLSVAFMSVMTVVTLWLAVGEPVEDCGCFGDAVRLTNWQTFGKNVVLLLASAIVCWRPLSMVRFISKANQGIIMNYSALFILSSSAWCLYDLPIFDFRPYYIGADIREGMEIPDNAKLPQFETTFILEKNGERKEFTLDDYPDSTWTFIDSKTVQTEAGYVPPIHDFFIKTAEGDDVTEQVLADESYTFLLVSPHLENADDTNFGEIDRIYEYAQERGCRFYGLTASGKVAIGKWREMTGAEYEFFNMDETTLKTIIRSNPGLLLIKDGTVVGKWSHNLLPDNELLDESLSGKADGNVVSKILKILAWFVLPLLILTIADRLWAWSSWVRTRRQKKGQHNNIQQ